MRLPPRNPRNHSHQQRVLPRCFTEVMLRIANPARQLAPSLFVNGEKGSKAFDMFQAEMRVLLDEMKRRGPPPSGDHDIASQLYRAMAEHHEITEDRVLSEIGILFVEGFETTAPDFLFTLPLTPPPPDPARPHDGVDAAPRRTCPGVQDRVAEELDALGLLAKPGCPPPREMEFEDLRKLPYLVAVAKEAMRVLPVVSIMGRVTERLVRIGKFTVPPGVVVSTPLYAIHNTKHNWEAPQEFRPERWLDVPVETFVYNSQADASSTSGAGFAPGNKLAAAAAAAASREGITFMPFSDGPRSCVGQSLAKAEVITLLAKILGSFTITLAPEMGGLQGVLARESTHLTLQTRGTKGIRMHMTPRSEAVAGGAVCAPACA
ncbi:Cytochrome P450 3A28 [Monoraphidium neglectum]|uniref:Cytochrome P450 3A28 n=1 Tax=Monoraphidium neglectum TaxID=145388 RepID=A0A0D2MDH2_9CHLO|nr:Cytochrome P450 3A28 [Monoraphidium neglectum]KIY98801.1 Cytochrome P450 3A28 [Monoraphidium neglectum]|eukprot:XP_013897821.1 Cytochrome P450 3A28 [Monoraphidium neglectum]